MLEGEKEEEARTSLGKVVFLHHVEDLRFQCTHRSVTNERGPEQA